MSAAGEHRGKRNACPLSQVSVGRVTVLLVGTSELKAGSATEVMLAGKKTSLSHPWLPLKALARQLPAKFVPCRDAQKTRGRSTLMIQV